MNPILEGVKDILDILKGSSWTNEQRLDLVKFWIETRTKQGPELEIKSGPAPINPEILQKMRTWQD